MKHFNGVATKDSYLQELILTSSLRASSASLEFEKDYSEIMLALRASFTNTCRWCPYKQRNGCPLTTAIGSWLQEVSVKATSKPNPIGMGSEMLRTHPFGRKTSAARLLSIPNTQVGCTILTITSEFEVVPTHHN